jgi:NitT/TauT family transport system permease protein
MPESSRPTDDTSRTGEISNIQTIAHDAEIAGIDALEIPIEAHPSPATRAWRATWPVVTAVAGFLLLWQIAVWLEIRPSYALAGPLDVLERLVEKISDGTLVRATAVTMTRALVGYVLAFVIGSLIGLAVVGNRAVRTAVASMITGLQTMPSIVWFPLAILLFGLTENAILFVVILGAAPSIANGLIMAVDQIPPILMAAGRVLGARRWSMYRHVILPAALPSFVGGMKQGWAFAWRSLMAGEIVVSIGQRISLGFVMHQNQTVSDAVGLMAAMVLVFLIGVLVDRLVFTRLEASVRTRWGLTASI